MTNNNELPDWLIVEFCKAYNNVLLNQPNDQKNQRLAMQAALSTLPIMEMIEALESLELTAGLPAMEDDPARVKARAVLDKINKLRGENG